MGRHDIDLAEIRRAAGLTQVEMADRLGLQNGQRTVSQMERRDDWLLSRFLLYLQATGAEVQLSVKVNDLDRTWTFVQ